MFGYPTEAWADPGFFASVLHPGRPRLGARRERASRSADGRQRLGQRVPRDRRRRAHRVGPATSPGRSATKHGRPQYQQGCMIDVTVQKQAEAELAAAHEDLGRQKQYFESLVEVSPVAVVTTMDHDEVVTGWNPAAGRLFGRTRPTRRSAARSRTSCSARTSSRPTHRIAPERRAVRRTGRSDHAEVEEGRLARRRRGLDGAAPRRWRARAGSSSLCDLPRHHGAARARTDTGCAAPHRRDGRCGARHQEFDAGMHAVSAS